MQIVVNLPRVRGQSVANVNKISKTRPWMPMGTHGCVHLRSQSETAIIQSEEAIYESPSLKKIHKKNTQRQLVATGGFEPGTFGTLDKSSPVSDHIVSEGPP